MLPIFQVLSECRPSVKDIFSKLPHTKDPEELKIYLDKVESILTDYWSAERDFTGSLSFGKFIPFRYYFRQESAENLIAKAQVALENKLMTVEDMDRLKSAIMKERLK